MEVLLSGQSFSILFWGGLDEFFDVWLFAAFDDGSWGISETPMWIVYYLTRLLVRVKTALIILSKWYQNKVSEITISPFYFNFQINLCNLFLRIDLNTKDNGGEYVHLNNFSLYKLCTVITIKKQKTTRLEDTSLPVQR